MHDSKWQFITLLSASILICISYNKPEWCAKQWLNNMTNKLSWISMLCKQNKYLKYINIFKHLNEDFRYNLYWDFYLTYNYQEYWNKFCNL